MAQLGDSVLAEVEAALRRYFEQEPSRAEVSFVGVNPVRVLRFVPLPGRRAYVSLGMSRQPMTGAAQTVQQADGPRAELLVEIRDPSDELSELWRSLAVLAAAPVVEGVVYTAGISVDTGQPLVPGSWCTGGVLAVSTLSPIPTDGGAVRIMQLLPATPNELAWCRVHGSEPLRQRWTGQGTDLADLRRGGAELD